MQTQAETMRQQADMLRMMMSMLQQTNSTINSLTSQVEKNSNEVSHIRSHIDSPVSQRLNSPPTPTEASFRPVEHQTAVTVSHSPLVPQPTYSLPPQPNPVPVHDSPMHPQCPVSSHGQPQPPQQLPSQPSLQPSQQPQLHQHQTQPLHQPQPITQQHPLQPTQNIQSITYPTHGMTTAQALPHLAHKVNLDKLWTPDMARPDFSTIKTTLERARASGEYRSDSDLITEFLRVNQRIELKRQLQACQPELISSLPAFFAMMDTLQGTQKQTLKRDLAALRCSDTSCIKTYHMQLQALFCSINQIDANAIDQDDRVELMNKYVEGVTNKRLREALKSKVEDYFFHPNGMQALVHCHELLKERQDRGILKFEVSTPASTTVATSCLASTPEQVQCHECNGFGHYATDCANRRGRNRERHNSISGRQKTPYRNQSRSASRGRSAYNDRRSFGNNNYSNNNFGSTQGYQRNRSQSRHRDQSGNRDSRSRYQSGNRDNQDGRNRYPSGNRDYRSNPHRSQSRDRNQSGPHNRWRHQSGASNNGQSNHGSKN